MKQFGELNRAEQLALFEAWLDGKEIECYNECLDEFEPALPSWDKEIIYRIKPTKPSIDWDHVHPDYVALTEEESGEPHLHKTAPMKDRRGWYSESKTTARTHASYKAGTCNWIDSLVMRPDL